MEALKIDRLSKQFGGLQVLRDLSLTVEVGERMAIIGPNGAGKTTLLNVVIGELAATEGRLFLFGEDITGLSVHRRVHEGLGRSFQITRLFYNLTVLSNISLALQGISPSRYQMFRQAARYAKVFTEAERWLKVVDLWHKKDELASSISYGEQRKMEIILALASRPRVLLLDEPSAGIAVAERRTFIDLITSLATDTTIIFTDHDMDVVFGLANRVIVLYFGQIIAEGTPEQIQSDPKVREIYLGVKSKKRHAPIS
jgi:branched-chain amino acid transport system ATP-binding protein